MVFRLGMLVPWTLGLFIVGMCLRPFTLLYKPSFPPIRYAFFRLWGIVAAWIMGIRVEIRGTPPKPPFFLVMNHLGYIDMILNARATGCVFVAMVEVSRWPILGFIGKWIDCIFIDRKDIRDTKRVNEMISGEIRAGHGILLQPEGGNSPGHEVLPFKTPLLQPAVEDGWPVHYATIYYRAPDGFPHASQSVSWSDGSPLKWHGSRLLRLPHIEAVMVFAEEPVIGTERKELAQELWQDISDQLVVLKREMDPPDEPLGESAPVRHGAGG